MLGHLRDRRQATGDRGGDRISLAAGLSGFSQTDANKKAETEPGKIHFVAKHMNGSEDRVTIWNRRADGSFDQVVINA